MARSASCNASLFLGCRPLVLGFRPPRASPQDSLLVDRCGEANVGASNCKVPRRITARQHDLTRDKYLTPNCR